MKPEITGLVGSHIQQEISKSFIENMTGLAEFIDAKFQKLEQNNL